MGDIELKFIGYLIHIKQMDRTLAQAVVCNGEPPVISYAVFGLSYFRSHMYGWVVRHVNCISTHEVTWPKKQHVKLQQVPHEHQ